MLETKNHAILIIDDSPDDIELASVALEFAGLDIGIRYALDGISALRLLKTGKELPSVILLDIKMPGMSGLDLLREIRQDAGLNKIPVVMVTSSTLEDDRVKSLSAGANGFLHKSFSINQFGRELKDIIDHLLNYHAH